jgi:hypothetical protein
MNAIAAVLSVATQSAPERDKCAQQILL